MSRTSERKRQTGGEICVGSEAEKDGLTERQRAWGVDGGGGGRWRATCCETSKSKLSPTLFDLSPPTNPIIILLSQCVVCLNHFLVKKKKSALEENEILWKKERTGRGQNLASDRVSHLSRPGLLFCPIFPRSISFYLSSSDGGKEKMP